MRIDARLMDAIERLNSDEEQRHAETFRFMEEQKIKKALGSALWEDLKARLSEDCDAIAKSSPAKLSVSTQGAYAISLTNLKSGRTAELTYNRDVPCVFYKTPSGSGRLVFRVSQDGNSISFLLNDIPKSLDDLTLFFIQPLIS